MNIILSGGLGNQMFQYALYMALKEKKTNVKLDTSLYYLTEMHNGFELERIFSVDHSYSNSSKLYGILLRFVSKFCFYPLSITDNGDFNKIIFTKSPLYLLGYWQSELYFKNIEFKIREVFEFKEIDKITKDYSTNLNSSNSVSIHIRRGDYIGINSVEGICTKQYYLNSIEYINNFVEKPVFHVFSNDINYCKSIFEGLNIKTVYVDWNWGKNSYKDMYLMSQCKHNIIANSSFSWWGAWLNKNYDKIVIAPFKWVNDNDFKNMTIIPENWIKISN